MFPAVREAIRRAQRDSFRICEFSVQANHVHLLVEAKGREALSRGVQGLAIRLARAVNRVLARRGCVWSDRYHVRALPTPREVRNALVYVLMNHRKHGVDSLVIDRCSSAPWFTGWQAYPKQMVGGAVSPPVVEATTWLLRVGWLRHGLIEVSEAPRRERER